MTVDDEEVVVEKVNSKAACVTFHHLLDMKRRLEGVFQLTNSHAYMYLEAKRLVIEVLDSDMRGLGIFILQQKEYTKSGLCSNDTIVVPLYMETWRIMSHVLKSLPNRKKKVQLRLEWLGPSVDAGYKFGFVTLENEEFTYMKIQHDAQKTHLRLPSLYRDNPILEPNRYSYKVTMKCPLQFEIICKECCTYGETLNLMLLPGNESLVLFTQKHINTIKYTMHSGGSLLKIDAHPKQAQPEHVDVYQFPLRILRVITRFCSGIETLVIYLGKPVTFVAKRAHSIRWTLRLRADP